MIELGALLLAQVNPLALNARTALQKKIGDFHREVSLVFAGVDLEQNFAARVEMSIQVVQEKFPFVRIPTTRLVFAAIKRSRKTGYQIELAAEIRQRLECPDSPGHALQAEELNQLVGKREISHIEAKAFVTGLFG